MPIYTAPVRETRFILEERARHRPLFQPPWFFQRLARPGRGDPRGGGPVCRRGAPAAEPGRRRGRLQARRRRLGHHAARFQGGVPIMVRGRLADADRSGRVWRAGPAPGRRHRGQRICPVRQPQLRDVPGPDLGRDRLADGQGVRRIEGDLRPQDGHRRMDRDDEPHRTPLRHRSWPAQDPRRGQCRRQLCDHRHENLHFVWRA